jgi:hypothetical protein
VRLDRLIPRAEEGIALTSAVPFSRGHFFLSDFSDTGA